MVNVVRAWKFTILALYFAVAEIRSEAMYDEGVGAVSVTTKSGLQQIRTPFGTARFSTPRGWSLARPAAAQSGFTISPRNDWSSPHIFTSCAAYQGDLDASSASAVQDLLQNRAVKQLHAHDFTQASIVLNHRVRLPSGRELRVYYRTLNSPELVVFIPERGCYVQVTFKVFYEKDLVPHRKAFDAFLRSYQFESRRNI